MACRVALVLTTVICLANPTSADQRKQSQGKLISEVWEAVLLEGRPAGHVFSQYRSVQVGQTKYILAATKMELRMQRFGQTMEMRFYMADTETESGQVRGFLIRQTLSKGQELTRRGKIVGNQLVLTTEITNREPKETKMPWDDRVIGLYAQERLFANRRVRPHMAFDFIKFEPTFDTYLTVHVTVKDYEEVTLRGGRKQRLLRVESRIDKIRGISFPPEITWIDERGRPLKRQVEMFGLGKLEMYRTSREDALSGRSTASADIGLSQLVRVNRSLFQPSRTREIVYRVRLKGVDDASSAFASGGTQEVRNVKRDQVDVVVRGLVRPRRSISRTSKEPPAEYLRSNRYLPCDDERIRRLARTAVGNEKDPWQKAVRITRWVSRNLKNKNYSEAFATADEVARRMEGDCTEHSVLAAAMCRSVGVPARTAVGLIHLPQKRAMGYHMWIEVWVDGQWYPLDPTFGQAPIGADHLKIADHHWNDTEGLMPLLAVARVVGRLEIEIMNVKYGTP